MSDSSSSAAETAPVAPGHAMLPADAVSHGKPRGVFSVWALLLALATMALGYWVLLGGEALVARFGLAPERALAISGALSAVVLLLGGGAAAAVARRIGLLELTLGWLVVTIPLVAFLSFAMLGPAEWARFVPPDLLYLSSLLDNPVTGLLLGAHAVYLVALLGATLGYVSFGGGSLDLHFSFEAHVASQHLRLSPQKVVLVFALGIVSPLLLLLWPLTLISLTLAYAVMSSQTRRRVLEQLMPYIAILGVSIGVCALVTVLSVMSGFEVDLKKKILGANAHAVVMKYGTDFSEYREVAEKVRGVRGVKGVSPFALNEVMLTSEQNLQGALIKGIDPSTVGQVTDLPANIADTKNGGQGKLEWLDHPDQIPVITPGEGNVRKVQEELEKAAGTSAGGPQHPAPKPDASPENVPTPVMPTVPGIVLGTELAKSLRVFVGDRVNVVSPLGGELGPQGPMPKSRPFRVAAIFYSGMYEYDSKFAYIGLDSAQKFFGMGDTVQGLEIRVDDIDNTRVINRGILKTLGGYPFRTKDWGEMNHNLFSALRLEKLAMAIMLTFIVLVACINILSTLVVFALQKAKEVAILKSMGARDTGIMKIFVLEGLIIGSIGTVLGLIQGYGCCQFVEKFGIRMDPQVYYISKLPVRMDGLQFLVVAVIALVLAYLATIFPALNASRLRPVEGLKTE
ncbi:MAG: ABC transporter permease [Deltaproteobacteria bacterium]|nr:ABC transporter permease [Deltaproteobacteria bacterium]